jgi:Fe2+ or Zn2+ uptake regulation protein
MTTKQAKVLQFVREWWAENKTVPKLREVKEGVEGIKRLETVYHIYIALARMGFLTITPDGYRVATWCPCCDGRLAV